MEDLLARMEETEEDTQKDRFLTFPLGRETYGIEIRYVTEIIGIQPITGVPELPSYMQGMINLRGRIIPVMDVRLRFGKEFRDYDERTCIIVIDLKGSFLGLIVDGVSEVLSIPGEDIAGLPDMGAGQGARYVRSIGKVGSGVVLLIECERLLSAGDLPGTGAEASGAVL